MRRIKEFFLNKTVREYMTVLIFFGVVIVGEVIAVLKIKRTGGILHFFLWSGAFFWLLVALLLMGWSWMWFFDEQRQDALDAARDIVGRVALIKAIIAIITAIVMIVSLLEIFGVKL